MGQQRILAALAAAALALMCAGCEKQVSAFELNTDLGGGTVLVRFTGTLEKGVPAGTGSAELTTDGKSWTYEGTFSEGVPFAGEAADMPVELTVGDETIPGTYDGQIASLEMSGEGVFTAAEGDFTCEGVFDIGGLSKWQSYEVSGYEMELALGGGVCAGTFDGRFEGDGPTGTGTFTAADGSALTYTGRIVDGALPADEPVTLSGMAFGLEYEGQTLAGTYDGDVLAGVPSGTGSFAWEDGEDYFRYTGAWEAGAMAGAGEAESSIFVVHLPDGDAAGVYQGGVEDGVPSGEGTFTAGNADGDGYTYQGQWAGGLWNGQGQLRTGAGEGTLFAGTFTDGRFTPTFQEYMTLLGTIEPQFTLSEATMAAAEGYAFAPDRSVMADYTDETLTYEICAEDPEASETALLCLEGYRLARLDRWDETLFDPDAGRPFSQTVTEMIITDENGGNACWVEYFGALEQPGEDATVTVRGLPLAMSDFRDGEGVSVRCMVMLGAEVLFVEPEEPEEPASETE